MQEKGLEPSRPCGHRHLKPARLPIPPLLHFYAASGYQLSDTTQRLYNQYAYFASKMIFDQYCKTYEMSDIIRSCLFGDVIILLISMQTAVYWPAIRTEP